MSRRLPLALILIGLAGVAAPAQEPFHRSMIPTRSALGRLGMESQWMAVVPLGSVQERVLLINRDDDILFAQTNRSNLHVFNANTGQYLWGASLGRRATRSARPASANSDMVFATSSDTLYALHKPSGHEIWTRTLGFSMGSQVNAIREQLPSTATACDEELAMVGLRTGKLVAYTVRDHSQDNPRGFSAGTQAWAWQTEGVMTGRPIPAGKLVAFASADHRVYVAFQEERTLLYRFLTGGPITASMGTYGTRTLIVPSEDNNLYAIDLFDGETKWIFPSGAPIDQEPLVAGKDVLVINRQGLLSNVDAESGQARWTGPTGGADLLAVSGSRVYLRNSESGDLVLFDRASGRLLADARATRERAGLDLRAYTLAPTNDVDDRLYMATPSGLVVCLREANSRRPMPLRDPSEPAFGSPPLDEPVTPPDSPVADPMDDAGLMGPGDEDQPGQEFP